MLTTTIRTGVLPMLARVPRAPWFRQLGEQVLIVGFFMIVYFGVRGLTEGREDTAFDNARRLLDLEAGLGIDVEQSAQAWILDHRPLVTAANWVYIWGHWPIIIGTLVWLFARHRDDYMLLRNALIISGGLGLIVFVLFPVAPPRFLPEYVDTVSERSNSYRVLQPPGLVNKYAAMPSLHFGWNLLVGAVIYRVARTRSAEGYAVAGPMLMALAVVLTANHYIIDAVAGGIIALTGLALATRHSQRKDSPVAEPGRSAPALTTHEDR